MLTAGTFMADKQLKVLVMVGWHSFAVLPLLSLRVTLQMFSKEETVWLMISIIVFSSGGLLAKEIIWNKKNKQKKSYSFLS